LLGHSPKLARASSSPMSTDAERIPSLADSRALHRIEPTSRILRTVSAWFKR
jgi:hypothetical protein